MNNLKNKFFRFIKFLFCCFFFISCKNETNYDTFQDYETSGDSVFVENEIIEAPSKDIKWKDGNYYSYDYTEAITKVDSLGIEQTITVYKRNKPSEGDVACEPKICKWCSNTTYVSNYSIEEYPNINWLRGQPDLASIFGMLANIVDGNSYYDLDNNKVRTEWRTNCEYNGPEGFCSERCKSEYNYR